MITQVKMPFFQILSTHSLRNYMEISLEHLYVHTGALRVKKKES